MHRTLEPTVSVACVTYNHEKYIARAIEGFLAQKTTFPVEILIYDDASTDRTAKIVARYARRHPDVIVPMLQKENVYSKGGHPLLEGVLPKCRGKYIAICEGDDFWTDPLKLQKQVDFLEQHEDHVLVYTDFIKYDQASGRFYARKRAARPQGHVFHALLEGNFIATLTVLFRRDVFATIDLKTGFEQSFLQGDYPLWLEFSMRGKIGYIDERTAVYRHLSESASHSRSFRKQEAFYESTIRIVRYYSKKYAAPGYNEREFVQDVRLHLMGCAVLGACFEEARRYARLLEPRSFAMKILIMGCSHRWSFYPISLAARLREWKRKRSAQIHPDPSIRPDAVSAVEDGSVQNESALVGSESPVYVHQA